MARKRHDEEFDYLDMVANIIAEMIENYEMQIANEEANQGVEQYEELEEVA